MFINSLQSKIKTLGKLPTEKDNYVPDCYFCQRTQ
jgi:hypothetical protein